MIKEFEKLTREERELLLTAPVLVSVLASCSYNEVNQRQKSDAIKLAHLRAFTAPFSLLAYYREVEKIFEDEFEKAAKDCKDPELKSFIEKALPVMRKHRDSAAAIDKLYVEKSPTPEPIYP